MSSLAVALGVILEGPELAYETAAVIRPSRNGKRKKPLWITWVALVGWLFVVIGVAGEGVAEALVSKADGLIQTFNDIVLAAAERESAVAELRAGQAEQRAAEANAKADGFRLQISVSQEQAVKAEKESAQARLDLEKFKAPRTLTPKQRENLIAAIQRFSGQKFSLQVTDNPESLKFMQLLREALLSAGWVRSPSQVGDTELDGAGVTIDSGIKVGVTYDAAQTTLAAASALVLALRGIGFTLLAGRDKALKSASVVNLVPRTVSALYYFVFSGDASVERDAQFGTAWCFR